MNPRARKVFRPTIPAISFLSAGVWLGIVLAEKYAWKRHVGASGSTVLLVSILLASCALVMLSILLMSKFGRQSGDDHRSARIIRGSLFLLLLGVILGLAAGSLFWDGYQKNADAATKIPWSQHDFELVSAPSKGRYAVSVSGATTVAGTDVVVRMHLPKDAYPKDAYPILKRGKLIRCSGTFTPIGDQEFDRTMMRKTEVATFSPRSFESLGYSSSLRGRFAHIRDRCMERFANVGHEKHTIVYRYDHVLARLGMGEDSGSTDLLGSMILGDASALSDTVVDQDFRICGLTHLIAISGGHLVLLAELLSKLLSRFRLKRRVLGAILFTFLLLFVLLTGAPASGVRALFMVGVTQILDLFGRRKNSMAALGFCVFVCAMISPKLIFDIGFTLSVLAVAGIILFSSLFKEWIDSLFFTRRGFLRKNAVREFISTSLAMTLSAQILTAPVIAGTFKVFSLVSFLANIAVAPLLNLALNAGVIGLGLSVPSQLLATPVLQFAHLLAETGAFVAHRLAALPGASISARNVAIYLVISLVLAISLWAIWPRPTKRRSASLCVGLACLIALISILPSYHGDRIVMLDVGQGDAFCIQGGGKTVLVDTGPDQNTLKEELSKVGIRRIDIVVITHLHDDHYGGLEGLRGTIPVSEIIVPAGTLAETQPASVKTLITRFKTRGPTPNIEEIKAGETIHLGDFELDILAPKVPVADPATNEASIVFLYKQKNFKALFTGDAEEGILRAIPLEHVDMYKVGHHGSKVAIAADELEELDPKIALIGVGAHNRFGHPTEETLDLLSRQEVTVYRSDTCGTTEIDVGDKGYTVRRSVGAR